MVEVARALIDAIRADPEDEAKSLVLSDLLTEQGDPRGELIALQVRLFHAQAKKEQQQLRRRETAHLKKHRDALLGKGGVLALSNPTWWRGFIHTARTPPSVAALNALLTHPSGTFLHELTLQNPFLPLGELVDAVAQSKHPSLSSIVVNTADRGQALLDPVDITGLARDLPMLKRLDVSADEITLKAVPSQLEDVYLVARVPALGIFQRIAAGDWPKLKHLSIDHFLGGWNGNPTTPKQELFRGLATPSLESLAIRNMLLDRELIAQLATSPLLRRLRVLDLSHTGLDEDAVQPLLADPKRLAHLEKVVLTGSRLSYSTRMALER